jgi:hypothetical protein
MRRVRLLSLGLCLGAIAVACASAKERGDKAMESGNFESAVQNYESAVKRDPNDQESIAGLKRAREELLGQKLIQVRLARQGGNSYEALGHLLRVIDLENTWKFFPGGKIGFTQEEESKAALGFAKGLITADLKAMQPLKAELFLRSYKPIFSVDGGKEFNAVQAAVNKTGKQHCGSFAKQVIKGRPYFARWVASYCQFWGENLGKSAAFAEPLSNTLYGDVKVKLDTEGLAPEIASQVGQAVDEALTKTPWYDAQGKNVVEATLMGSFTQSKNKNGIILIHTYSALENYTEKVPVQKIRQVAYTAWEQRLDPSGATRSVPVQRYRDETYWEQVDQTKSRSVEKNFRYPAWKHDQQLAIHLAGTFVINGKTIDASVSDKSNADGIEHDENHPEMGLKPSRPDVPNAATWQKEKVAAFAAAFRDQAAALWRTAFCEVDASAASVADSGDRVAKCVRSLGENEATPPFAEEWYVKNTGVSAKQASGLLDRGRKI